MSKRLAIVTTHPIQYNAPWFKLLAKEQGMDVKVFYTWEQSQNNAKFDPGFGKVVSWDIPLLDGYDHIFVKNVAADQGSHHYKGIDNPTLNAEIKEWKPDSILVIGWPFKSHLSCMRYFKGKVPILFRGDSTLLNETPGIKKIIRRLFLTYIYSFIDHALYVGTHNKQYFLAHGVKEKELVYVPHAIDNDRFSANDEQLNTEAKEWRHKLDIKDTDIVTLYAGKLEDVKAPHYLIDLALELNEPGYKFLIIGNGPMEAELKAKANDGGNIIFLDFQNQRMMPLVYRLGDVVILPSKSETWGLAINEAMACGKPVIATAKCGGAIDLIHTDNGLIIKNGDIESAAEYIRSLKHDPNKLWSSGIRSKQIIADFSFQRVASAIIECLDKNGVRN